MLCFQQALTTRLQRAGQGFIEGGLVVCFPGHRNEWKFKRCWQHTRLCDGAQGCQQYSLLTSLCHESLHGHGCKSLAGGLKLWHSAQTDQQDSLPASTFNKGLCMNRRGSLAAMCKCMSVNPCESCHCTFGMLSALCIRILEMVERTATALEQMIPGKSTSSSSRSRSPGPDTTSPTFSRMGFRSPLSHGPQPLCCPAGHNL